VDSRTNDILAYAVTALLVALGLGAFLLGLLVAGHC
jgi:hypothetical protein